MEDYRDFVVYVDDRRFEYHIEKRLEPVTDTEWYDFIDYNAIDKEEKDFLFNSEHIRVYIISPSIDDGLLVTEFDTDDVFREDPDGGYIYRESDSQKVQDVPKMTKTDNSYTEEHDEEGVKYDNGKPLAGDMIMIFPHALMGVAKCIEWGSHKYPQTDNYIRLKNGYKRYMNGIMRHLLKIMLGQDYDDETKLPHIYHVCWNALAICEHWFKNRKEEEKEQLMEGLLMPYDKYFSNGKTV